MRPDEDQRPTVKLPRSGMQGASTPNLRTELGSPCLQSGVGSTQNSAPQLDAQAPMYLGNPATAQFDAETAVVSSDMNQSGSSSGTVLGLSKTSLENSGTVVASESKASTGIPDGLRQHFEHSYTLVKELGRGGMGRAMLAKGRAGEVVVIKILEQVTAQNSDYQRFIRESAALNLLSHANIVKNLGHGVHWLEDSGTRKVGVPYIVMGFIEGESLKQLTGQNGLDVSWAVEIFTMLASAVAHCHSKGIIHRDIKPENIMIDKGLDEPVLIDFGIARADQTSFEATVTAFQQSLTNTGQAIGTPLFMSPEQLFGYKGRMSTKADVWGLAATMFYCLTGRCVFPVRTPGDLIDAMKESTPDKVRDLRPECPEWLSDLIAACLSKEPEDRPTAEDLHAALKHRVSLSDAQSIAKNGGKSNKLVLAVFVAALLSLLVGLVYLSRLTTTNLPTVTLNSELKTKPVFQTQKAVYSIDGQLSEFSRGRHQIVIVRAGSSEKLTINVNEDGEFSTVQRLDLGRNVFKIEIHDENGNLLTQEQVAIQRNE